MLGYCRFGSKILKNIKGSKYVQNTSVEFAKTYAETTPVTPVFFILSPGVDPLKEVEKHGKKLGYTVDVGNFHNISLGQGQEIIAENAMEIAAEKGHWIILQNIHLVKSWLSTLEKLLEKHGESAHPNFRVFISAESTSNQVTHTIPPGILESAIKVTNEPPTGMQTNLRKALEVINQEVVDMSSKESEFKPILFALCYFHAAVTQRCKFGPQGWNKKYPFNNGDLNISINILYNYLENNHRVPWENLRYLFGDIMYGGHITDDWDRRLCRAYLEKYINPKMFSRELYLAPGFLTPSNLDFKSFGSYVEENIPAESPYLYGLHPNAEIGYLTTTTESLFRVILELQPKEISLESRIDGTQNKEEIVS